MKQKHIDASREVRLWLGQIVIPACAGVLAISPEAREWTRRKLNEGVNKTKKGIDKIKLKFKK